MIVRFLLALFMLMNVAHASSYYWFCGDGPGSKYFWEHGSGPGSLYYWNNGTEAGSRYYWLKGDKIGSQYYWSIGDDRGSQYYLQKGDGPDSAYQWSRGDGIGSQYQWERGVSSSTLDIFIPLCLNNIFVSAVCPKLRSTAQLSKAPYNCVTQSHQIFQQFMHSMTNPHSLTCPEDISQALGQ